MHQNEESNSIPVSDLTRRLVRRATEPIGVIDTRHAFELHARSTVLPAQRLALAKEFATRYGVEPIRGGSENSTSTIEMPLVSPKQSSESPFQLGSAPPWGSTTVPTETPKNLVSTTSPVQYRVKRPGSHAAPLSTPVAGERAADVGIQTNAPLTAQVQPQREPTQTVVGTTLEVAPRTLRRTDEVSQQTWSFPTVALPTAREVPHIELAAEMPVQRQFRSAAIDSILTSRGNLPAVRDKTVPQASESPRPAAAATMPLKFTTVADSLVPQKAATQSTQQSAPMPPAFNLDAPMSQVFNLDHAPVSERQLRIRVDDLPVDGPKLEDNTNADPGLAGSKPLSQAAVVAETQVPPSPMAFTGFVWRKAESPAAGGITMPQQAAGLSGPTYSSEMPIMRQSASEPMAAGADSHLTLPGSSDGGIDLTRLAEQVSRILTRQLRISRERRGRTR